MNLTITLKDAEQAAKLWGTLKGWKDYADAGNPISVSIFEANRKRTQEQNKKLHAIVGDMAEQVEIEGKRYSQDTWKEWVRYNFIGTEELTLPGGQRIERGISTTTLSVAEFSEMLDKLQAHAVSEFGVEFTL